MKVIYNGSADVKTFKDILSTEIPRLIETDKDVVYLDADLMNCIGTAKFAAANPERAINCGIAESNMAGIAAGLASQGFKPICHTFGPFASRRCVDQIFISCAYAKLNVRIIGSDPGVTAAYNGGLHFRDPFSPNRLVFRS